MAYLAAYLSKHGIPVKILDAVAEGMDIEIEIGNQKRFGLTEYEIKKYIQKDKPSVVGIACNYTAHSRDSHDFAKLVKAVDARIMVIFGGVHASTCSEKILEDPNVDMVVRGEGEETLLEIVNNIKNGLPLDHIEGTTVRADGKVKLNKPRPLIQDLDTLPFPARELMPYEKYMQAYRLYTNYLRRDRVVTMVSSRGCPMDCIYCAVKTVWGKTWRGRSAKNVVDEIEFLINEYNIGEIHFLDDSMAVNKQRLNDICDEIIKRKIDIRWTTPNGIAVWQLDKGLINKMKKSGCYRLTFGLESANKRTLKFINKQYSLEQAEDIINHCHKIGIWTIGTFIVGFPDEQISSINDTITYAVNSKLDFAVFYAATPFPGTRLYEIFQEDGLIINQSVSLFFGGCHTKYFSPEELNSLRDMAFRKLLKHRFTHMGRFLVHIRSREDIKYVFKLIKNFLYLYLMRKGAINPGSFWKKRKMEDKGSKFLDNLVSECLNTIKRTIPIQNNRLDLDSKIYFEGVKNDLILVSRFLPKSSKILDIGCGKGIISVLMNGLGFMVDGIDLEETIGEQLEISERRWQENIWRQFKNKFGVDYEFYNGVNIPFENEYFDAVVAYAVVEHLLDIDIFLAEVKRVLKKQGLLFIFRCPRKWAIAEYIARFFKLSFHKKLLAERKIIHPLRKQGFRILKAERTDLIPGFPPPRLQNYWNSLGPQLLLMEKVFLKSPLNIFSHHLRIIAKKS